MKLNKSFLAILVLLLASIFILGAGCEQKETTGQTIKEPVIKEATITMESFQFNPKELTINKGTKVIWKNEDPVVHRIVNNQGEDLLMGALFDIYLKPGEQESFTFNEEGTYYYHCHLHPNMKGKIVVT